MFRSMVKPKHLIWLHYLMEYHHRVSENIHCLQKVFPLIPLYDIKLPLFVGAARVDSRTWYVFSESLGSKCANFQQKIFSDISWVKSQTLNRVVYEAKKRVLKFETFSSLCLMKCLLKIGTLRAKDTRKEPLPFLK